MGSPVATEYEQANTRWPLAREMMLDPAGALSPAPISQNPTASAQTSAAGLWTKAVQERPNGGQSQCPGCAVDANDKRACRLRARRLLPNVLDTRRRCSVSAWTLATSRPLSHLCEGGEACMYAYVSLTAQHAACNLQGLDASVGVRRSPVRNMR